MEKEVFIVYAPVKELGDNGHEEVNQAVAAFDDYGLAANEMQRLIKELGCDWCIGTLVLNETYKAN